MEISKADSVALTAGTITLLKSIDPFGFGAMAALEAVKAATLRDDGLYDVPLGESTIGALELRQQDGESLDDTIKRLLSSKPQGSLNNKRPGKGGGV